MPFCKSKSNAKTMAAGLPKLSSCPVYLPMETHGRKQSNVPRHSLCESWPIAWSTVKKSLKWAKSSRCCHEPLASHQGEARIGRFAADWLVHQASIGVAS